MSSNRFLALEAFVKSVLDSQGGKLIPLGGDASFRKYYRFLKFIAVDSPPDTQKNIEFIRLDQALSSQGIRVPEIYAYDLEQGFLLLEDLGKVSFAQKAVGLMQFNYYQKALCILQKLAVASIACLPVFDKDFILLELGMFKEWMLEKKLGIKLSDEEFKLLAGSFEFLCEACLSQPYIPVHRDFHCRNLMILKSDQLAVIDFQDMVKGPVCYDLASLLFDCYLNLDDELILKLKRIAFNGYREAGIFTGSFAEFDRLLTLTSLQRHIKVLGIFCRLSLRDGKDQYLKDLPRVIDYVKSEASGFKELQGLLLIIEKYVSGKF